VLVAVVPLLSIPSTPLRFGRDDRLEGGGPPWHERGGIARFLLQLTCNLSRLAILDEDGFASEIPGGLPNCEEL
jgi:hypothetical protein